MWNVRIATVAGVMDKLSNEINVEVQVFSPEMRRLLLFGMARSSNIWLTPKEELDSYPILKLSKHNTHNSEPNPTLPVCHPAHEYFVTPESNPSHTLLGSNPCKRHTIPTL